MKKLYLLLIAVVIIGITGIFLLENLGYHKIEVDGGTIYGRITGNNKDLIVLMIAGSGPTDMNGNTPFVDGRNDSFIEVAKKLRKEGISTFRYDKRAAGKSSETFETMDMDFNIFVDDCVEVIKYIKQLGYKKIVVMGHSQGSLVGMLAATKEPVDGYISVAGTGYTIDKVLERQLLPQYDENSKEIKAIRALREGKIDKSFEESHPLFSLFSINSQKFILTWMEYEPSEIISKLDIPILLVQGDADTQVSIDDFEKLKIGAENAEYVLINKMNHVLKSVDNDKENTASYTDPSYPVHDELISSIIKFIKDVEK